MSEPIKLKPCPFCQADAELDTQRAFINYHHQVGSAVAVYCTNCPAEMSVCRDDFPGSTTDELVKIITTNWNHRTPPPAVCEL